MTSVRALKHVILMTRPHNCLIAAASVGVGAFLASGGVPSHSVAACLMAYLVCAGAYVLNDRFDVATDRVTKPKRALVVGAIGSGAALRLSVGLWTAAALPAILSGKPGAAFYLGWMVLLWLYSWRLKTQGMCGHFLVGLVASSGFVLGAQGAGDLKAGLLPASIALVLHLAREIVKGVADAGGDRAAGKRTLAVRIGGRKALVVALWCLAGVAGLSLLPFALKLYGVLYILPVAVVIYPLVGICIRRMILAIYGAGDMERTARSAAVMLKWVMPAGLLAFVLAGV